MKISFFCRNIRLYLLHEIDKQLKNVIKRFNNEGKWIKYVDDGYT